jgi:hypothetical protein
MTRPTTGIGSSVGRSPDRVIGVLSIIAGAALAFGAQVLAPVGVPLYDGVAVQEPYRYLHPSGLQPGGPSSYAKSVAVAGGASPQIAAPTTESPPQAQLIVLTDALALPPGTTRLDVSITPVDPPAVAPGGQIAGNVYRFTISDQSGTPVVIKPCSGCVSLVIRAPENTGNARLQHFANGVWTDVETVHAGTAGMYATTPTVLGDYAVVTGGAVANGGDGGDGGERGLGLESYLVAGGAAVILILLFVAALVARRRSDVAPPPRARAIPSKRKRPNKPPPRRPEP